MPQSLTAWTEALVASSSRAMVNSPCVAATHRGEYPSHGRKQSTCTLAASSMCTIRACPCLHATCSGDGSPSADVGLMAARKSSTNIFNISASPYCAAKFTAPSHPTQGSTRLPQHRTYTLAATSTAGRARGAVLMIGGAAIGAAVAARAVVRFVAVAGTLGCRAGPLHLHRAVCHTAASSGPTTGMAA